MRTHQQLRNGRPADPSMVRPARRRRSALVAAVALVAPLTGAVLVGGPADAKTVRKSTGDFRVIISPDRRSVAAGSTATFPVRLQTLRGFKLSGTTFDINAPDSIDAEIAKVGKSTSATYELDLTPAANVATSSNVYKLTVTSNRVVRTALLRLDVVGTTTVTPLPAPTPTPTIVPAPTTTLAPSFSLRPLRTSATVTTGETASFQVDVDRPTGYPGNVAFALSGVPSGMNANFAPNPTVRGTVLYVTPTASLASGRYTITGTATAGTLVRTVQFTIDVRTLGDFTMLPDKTAVTLTAPGKATYTLTPTGVGGAAPYVTYTVTGAPAGATTAFSANPNIGPTTLTVTTSSATPNGTYNLTVTGTSGSYSRSQLVQLVVNNAVPGFGLAATPGAISVTRSGASVLITVNVSTFGGFTGTIAIGATGAPTGVTTVVSASTATTATITVTATAGAAAGSFNLTISGTSGAYAASVFVPVTVS